MLWIQPGSLITREILSGYISRNYNMSSSPGTVLQLKFCKAVPSCGNPVVYYHVKVIFSKILDHYSSSFERTQTIVAQHSLEHTSPEDWAPFGTAVRWTTMKSSQSSLAFSWWTRRGSLEWTALCSRLVFVGPVDWVVRPRYLFGPSRGLVLRSYCQMDLFLQLYVTTDNLNKINALWQIHLTWKLALLQYTTLSVTIATQWYPL